MYPERTVLDCNSSSGAVAQSALSGSCLNGSVSTTANETSSHIHPSKPVTASHPSARTTGRVASRVKQRNDVSVGKIVRLDRSLTAVKGSFRDSALSAQSNTGILYSGFKYAFDMFGTLVLLVAVSPILPVIATAVKLTSPGPVIFKQRRLTKSGREFTLYKFRTMMVDAEKHSGAVCAVENDPRVTKIGSFLRTTRLDELPQLFNVLRGEMSLIGPRPERPEFAESIEGDIPGFYRRLQVKAGLTGLAQVGNGYTSSIEDYRKKLAWDRLYIQRRSVALDIWITVQTVWVVITGRGAR